MATVARNSLPYYSAHTVPVRVPGVTGRGCSHCTTLATAAEGAADETAGRSL